MRKSEKEWLAYMNTIIFWARVIKFWCLFRWIKNSKGFNKKRIPKSARKNQRIETKLPKYPSQLVEVAVQKLVTDTVRIYYKFGVAHRVEDLPFGTSTSHINVSIQTGSSNKSDNNTTGVSSCSEDNKSIFNTSSTGLPQHHRSIINSTDVDDYSVSDDSDNNKSETIIKKSTKLDNKRRHMERQLSSSKRDKLLFDE